MAPSAWVIVTCASIASLNCGTLYFFGAYSPQVASQLRYTAAQTSRIAIAGQSATVLAGPPCGHVIDAVGFTVPVVLGTLAIWLGYFLFYKQYSSAASNVPYSCFLFALIGVGSTGLSSACVKSSMLAWPARKGLAVALPLACYGASGIFFSRLGSWFTPGDTAEFLKMVASVTFGIGLVTAPVLCVYDWRRPRAPAASVAAAIEMQALSSPRPVLRHTEKPHALYTPEFWMVTAALGLLAGIGQMYIYGLGMIVCSLYALPSQTQQTLAAYDVARPVGDDKLQHELGAVQPDSGGDQPRVEHAVRPQLRPAYRKSGDIRGSETAVHVRIQVLQRRVLGHAGAGSGRVRVPLGAGEPADALHSAAKRGDRINNFF
ncbi:hypothetical protein KL943_005075 [Ogataea angusta]|nr:hypothetical protein KL943_005075 [Ogataea angusta]